MNPFWENGAHYDPHRYLSGQKDQVRAVMKSLICQPGWITDYYLQTRYNLWRFGFGPRQCLGKNVADRILRAITAELVLLYDLRVPKSTDQQDFGLQEESWIGLPDARIVCTKR